MDTSSGTSSCLQEAIDQRKRRRMLSNRESARRSRQRKQKRLDELSARAGQLRGERGHILAALAATARGRLALEAENSALRARAAELAARLRSLDDILLYMNMINADADGIGEPWNYQPLVNVPLAVGSMFHFQYC